MNNIEITAVCDIYFTKAKNIAIFCGRGNNGGDGFVAARLLAQKGAGVETYIVGSMSEVRGEAKINLERARGVGLRVTRSA